MPELPEVRAQAHRLDSVLGGRRLGAFEPLSFSVLKTVSPSPDALAGNAVVGVRARGKHLVIDVGDAVFVVHLMQAGRLGIDNRLSARPRNGLARWTFEEGPALLLTEAGKERRAGVWVVTGDAATQPPLVGLGPDADTVDARSLAMLLRSKGGRIHGTLRDQRVVAGIGRRLANEICHVARISPFAMADRLDDDQVSSVAAAITQCIAESDAFEAERDDMARSADRPARVHRRAGEPCPECGDTLRSVEYRTYEVDYCPTCQTGGRVLADNTTSRFLR